MVDCWGKFVYWFVVLNLRFWAMVLFRLRRHGLGNIPRGAVIIASNHVSHLDPPLVGIGVNRLVVNMAKKELFSQPWLLWFLRTIGTIVVDRGRGSQALNEAVDCLSRGNCVVIFPEGTRSQDGRLGRGHSGVIVMAIRSGCSIVPATIIGSEKAMTKGSRMIKPVPVSVHYGEPYQIEYNGGRDEIPRDLLRRETYRLMMKIEAMLPENMKTPAEMRRKWYGEFLTDEQT